MSSYFPLFVDVSNMKIVIIGGGAIAQRRIEVLRQFGAQIVMIAPEATPFLQELADFGQIVWLKREYREGDFADPTIGMAVIATDQRDVNHRASLEALNEAIPASVADCKEESTFYFPGIAKKDNVVCGITASGIDHRQAALVTRKIRQLLEEL